MQRSRFLETVGPIGTVGRCCSRLLTAGAALLLCCCLRPPAADAVPAASGPHPSSAAGQTRTLLVFNLGTRPIFDIRIGHRNGNAWSADLLGVSTIVDVSSGREATVELRPFGCVNDVLAVYQDGHREIINNVNLCTTDRVDFSY